MDEPCDHCGNWDCSESERIPEEELAEYRRMPLACNLHRNYDWGDWENVACRLLEHIDALEAEIKRLENDAAGLQRLLDGDYQLPQTGKPAEKVTLRVTDAPRTIMCTARERCR